MTRTFEEVTESVVGKKPEEVGFVVLVEIAHRLDTLRDRYVQNARELSQRFANLATNAADGYVQDPSTSTVAEMVAQHAAYTALHEHFRSLFLAFTGKRYREAAEALDRAGLENPER